MSFNAIVQFVLRVIIGGLIIWLLYWLVTFVALPQPFAKIATVALAVVSVFFLIDCLLSLIGKSFIKFNE